VPRKSSAVSIDGIDTYTDASTPQLLMNKRIKKNIFVEVGLLAMGMTNIGPESAVARAAL